MGPACTNDRGVGGGERLRERLLGRLLVVRIRTAWAPALLFAALFFGLAAGLGPARALEPPVRPLEEVERYVAANADALSQQFEAYNGRVGALRSPNGSTRLLNAFWSVERLDGESVFLLGRLQVGRADWDAQGGRFTVEFQWQGDQLRLVGHAAAPVVPDRGVTGEAGRACSPNYYAPKPCPDTVARWTEFTKLYGLPMDRNSATIFQAFAVSDFRAGERLLAAALGEPSPVVESVFPLQREIDGLNLSRYQQSLDNPCDLDPSGTRPCPEIDRVYRTFARRHGLPEGAASAAMFAAYAAGDFRSGDTLYALAKDLPRPDYEEPTAGIGRDAALAGLRPSGMSEGSECALNPYATKPCLSSIEAWQEFRGRYQLADNPESARIFEAYAEGDFTEGDQLFAEAKGVSIVQLLEAAGVPSQRLIIEVYPGHR